MLGYFPDLGRGTAGNAVLEFVPADNRLIVTHGFLPNGTSQCYKFAPEATALRSPGIINEPGRLRELLDKASKV